MKILNRMLDIPLVIMLNLRVAYAKLVLCIKHNTKWVKRVLGWFMIYIFLVVVAVLSGANVWSAIIALGVLTVIIVWVIIAIRFIINDDYT